MAFRPGQIVEEVEECPDIRPHEEGAHPSVIASGEAVKQSSSSKKGLDCFAALAMTGCRVY